MDARAAIISGMDTLSQAHKQEHDSLVHVQTLMIHSIQRLKQTVDSLKGVPNTPK